MADLICICGHKQSEHYHKKSYCMFKNRINVFDWNGCACQEFKSFEVLKY